MHKAGQFPNVENGLFASIESYTFTKLKLKEVANNYITKKFKLIRKVYQKVILLKSFSEVCLSTFQMTPCASHIVQHVFLIKSRSGSWHVLYRFEEDEIHSCLTNSFFFQPMQLVFKRLERTLASTQFRNREVQNTRPRAALRSFTCKVILFSQFNCFY